MPPKFRFDTAPRPRAKREKPELDLEAARTRARAAWDEGQRLASLGNLQGGLAWLGRAHRMAPTDQNLRFALAMLRLRAGDPDGAAELFGGMARSYDVGECWTGLLAASLEAGRVDDAVEAAQSALSAHAVDPALAGLAASVVARAGLAGWCGVRADGVLLTDSPLGAVTVRLDSVLISPMPAPGGAMLPEPWRHAARLDVERTGRSLLGSPIRLRRLCQVEGFVERSRDGLTGWAWLPASPSENPVLRILGVGGVLLGEIVANALAETVEGTTPLGRPRGFAWKVPAKQLVRVVGSDGRDLLGSPLAPLPPKRKAALRGSFCHDPAGDRPVDVVIPIYRGLETTLACLDSVLATVSLPTRIWVVNDASPEPELVDALMRLADAGRIRLISASDDPQTGNVGFPSAVNAGMRAAGDRHVILLNSDTLVAPGWLEALRDAACSGLDIGTATPISNSASILSFPGPDGQNPAPDLPGTQAMAKLAARANGGRLVEIPTAHGFCMFIRRDCLRQTGLFDTRIFAQGYGEENDFSERARALGWRHVAVPGVYVAHLGGVSFGPARQHLLRRNLGLLARLYPDYAARVAAHIAADPLAPSRKRLDQLRFRQARNAAGRSSGGAVLIVTHGGGGGTARIVRERAAALRGEGLRPVILRAVDGRCEVGEEAADTPNLSFGLPEERLELARFLKADRPVAAELHHLLGHDHSVVGLFAYLAIPYDVWVHDYSWLCARLSFVTGDGHFCGEADTPTCDTCVAVWGRGLEDPIAPADLRRRSAADLRGARAVIVPSEDVGRRLSRHIGGLAPVVRAWEEDRPFHPVRPKTGHSNTRVAVVGAIGIEKGFDVLLACAWDVVARDLPLEFVVVGYTVDDDKLLATGCVFVTGEFKAPEAVALIRGQNADIAFLPSIWPETWCYALSDCWEAGLLVATFEIGTPALRIRRTGGGWLMPLGLPAPSVNDRLMSIARQTAA